MLHSAHCTDTKVQAAQWCILLKLGFTQYLNSRGMREYRELCPIQGLVFERTHCPHTTEPEPVGLLHENWKYLKESSRAEIVHGAEDNGSTSLL